MEIYIYIYLTTYIQKEGGTNRTSIDVDRKCDLSSNSNAVDCASTEYDV